MKEMLFNQFSTAKSRPSDLRISVSSCKSAILSFVLHHVEFLEFLLGLKLLLSVVKININAISFFSFNGYTILNSCKTLFQRLIKGIYQHK